MASKMVRHLFDEKTRMTSNVNGRGKNQLDPYIIAIVKHKCFEFFHQLVLKKLRRIGENVY